MSDGSTPASRRRRPVSAGVSALVAEVAARLRAAEVPSAAVEARWIVSHFLGTSPAALVFAGPLSDDERESIEAAVTRRVSREPLQHILGIAPFGDLELAVGPGVFIPRPETEVMAQFALSWLAGLDRPAVVVDACSGSGALALAVACHVRAEVTAIEISTAADVWLQRNVAALKPRFSHRGSVVTVVRGDVAAADTWPASGSVDLVVSNPPYVPLGCVPRDPEVRDHDPQVALFGGTDGFDIVRPLVVRASAALRPGGVILIEHADDQGEPGGVPALLRRSGRFADIADHADFAGRPRFTSAVRR